ncbi:MAG: type II secretion system protein M [Pseudomonadota bacterium]
MRGLNTRERHLIVGSACVIALVGALQFAILPGLTSRQNSFAMLSKIDAVLSALDVLPTPSANAPAADQPPLRTRVTETAQRAGLEIRRIDPQGAALSVSLDQVPFPALIGWLNHLTQASGINIISAEIGRLSEPGHVSARFLLEAN